MLETCELRWFQKGLPLGSMFTRYTGKILEEELKKWNPRQDLYVILAGIESMGIKMRGEENPGHEATDKIEIKCRKSGGSQVELNGNQGYLEYWTKWAFNGQDDAEHALSSLLLKPEMAQIGESVKNAWVKVEKIRYSRRYEMTSDGSINRVPFEIPVELGCTTELTLLKVFTQEWWTFGFEASGRENGALEPVLKSIAAPLMEELGLQALSKHSSYGYPRWLLSLTP